MREQQEASRDAGERERLDHEITVGLWTRGVGIEQAWEILRDVAPERVGEIEPLLADARAQQRIAAQRLWGDPSQQ